MDYIHENADRLFIINTLLNGQTATEMRSPELFSANIFLFKRLLW